MIEMMVMLLLLLWGTLGLLVETRRLVVG